MKNKKGFTLVELLSTIAVLAIILGIVSAAYVGISKHIRTTYYKSLEESLLVTGGEYFAYTSDRPQMYGDVKKVSLKDVIDLKYTTNVLDKRGNTCDLETSYLAAYKNSYDKTNYYVCLICSQDNYKTTSRECSGEVDYSLKMVPTKNDTGTIYREGEWVNKYVKLTFTTLNDVSKVEIKSDDKTYSCNMNDSGLRTCSVNVLESGNYKYYGITNNQETKTEYINIKVDRNNPDFIILENNGVVQDKVSKEITSSSVDVNVKVNDIKDLESGVKSIRYSFEKGDTKKYVNIESTNTSFEINKTLSLGLTNLIIEIEDFAGNTSTRKVVFEVYNKVNKPDSTYCNSLTYNGVEQVLTKSAGTGYTFINNKGTNAGSYEVSARLNDNYKWNDNSTEDVKFTCTINRQTTATLGICNSLTYNGATQVLAKGGNNVTIKNNEGKDAKAYMVMYVANSNYAFSDNTTTKYLSCSINKKVLTVTAKSNQSKIYGSSDPTLTYNYSGNISGETPKFTGTLQRTAGENIGSYPINKGTLALANNGTFLANNYNLTFSGSTNFSITSKTIGSLTISLDNTSYTYDKTEKKPNVTIKDGAKTLTLNTDYTLSYSNNINAGTATVTITGKGNYKSSTTKNFTINKRSITVKANNQTINYGSSIATGVGYITVSNLVSGDTVTSITLTPSTSNVTTSGTITPSNISINNGSGNINYNPTYQKGTLVINRLKTATLGTCNSLTYNGATQVLAKGGNNVTIKNNEGKDAKAYMVMYVANSNYAFSDNTTTKYLSCSINKKVLTVTAKSNQSKIYGSSDPTLTYNYSGNISGETPKFTGTLQRTAGENIGSYPINKGTLALANNGTFLANNYNLTFSGSTNFSITSKTIGSLTISLDNTSYTYDKTEKKPNVTIKDGAKTLTLNTDYTLSYSNNINAGTATVTITGKGNYKSSTTKNFTINKRSITVKANNQTINYGSSIATGVGYITVSNLVSGDTVTSITLTPSTSNVTTSGTITPSNISINNGSGNINYNPTYQKGTLVINSVEVCANIYINGASKIGSKTTDTKECCNSTNGSSCNITLPTITPKSGFTALGYSDDGDSLTSANYSANQSVTIYKPTGDAELPSYYAITRSISQNTYYATFNLNGATSTSSNKLSCTAGYAYNGDELPDECSITLPTITRSGWTIIGWSENSSSHTATYSQGQKITLHDDIDLFAITSKNVTLKYNTNSSTTVTTDNLTSKTETKTIYNTDGAMFNIPTYANGKVCRNNGGDKYHGYQLLGLSSNQSGNNVEFCFGDQIYLENDKTLFLVWQDKYATAVGNVGNNLKLRSGPGTDYPQLASIGKGDLVYIQSSKYTWRDGHTWYPVVYGSKIGWAAGNRKNNSTLSNLTLKSTPNADSCGYTYSCTSNNKLLSITPSDVVLNITSNTSKRKMQQNLSIANQCGSMTDAISSNSSLVTATKGGVISAVSGSVPVNQTKSATVTFKTKYGCTETVNVLVKNTEATAPDITISVNGDSSTCSGSYIKGATATVTCRSDLPITSYSAKIGSTSYAPSTSGNTYTSTINLSSTGSKTINVTCANAEGSSTQSKTVSVKVRNASSSCGCSVRYSASTAGSTCSRCTSWSKHSTGIQSASAIGAYKNYCTYSGGVGAFIKVTYTNWRGGANTAYVADMTIYKCTSFACKTYKTCCHT